MIQSKFQTYDNKFKNAEEGQHWFHKYEIFKILKSVKKENRLLNKNKRKGTEYRENIKMDIISGRDDMYWLTN